MSFLRERFSAVGRWGQSDLYLWGLIAFAISKEVSLIDGEISGYLGNKCSHGYYALIQRCNRFCQQLIVCSAASQMLQTDRESFVVLIDGILQLPCKPLARNGSILILIENPLLAKEKRFGDRCSRFLRKLL